MTKTARLFLVAIFLLTNSISGIAQDTKEEIDPSKPTNFYTQIFSNFEYSSRKDHNLYGYRGNAQLATSSGKHLLLVEVPLLYNDATEKFGVSDIRFRYFGIAYKDYSKFFGVVAPSLDLFIPSGKIENGLGTDRWRVSPGVAVGLMIAPWIQAFPVVSYQFQSKTATDVPGVENKVEHGFTIQSITPIKLGKNTTLEVNPWLMINNVDQPEKDDFIMINRFYTVVKSKYQIGAFNQYHFNAKINTFRVFFVFFI